jgi:hypothetical protein
MDEGEQLIQPHGEQQLAPGLGREILQGALVTDVEVFMAARFNGVRKGSVADARRVSKVRRIQFIPRLQRRWRNIGQRH